MQQRLPPLLRPLLDGPVGTEEPGLPVALVLNDPLLKKIVISVVIPAAETELPGPATGKVKRQSRGASPVPGRAPVVPNGRPVLTATR
jgi:hypothetical protein